LVGRLLIGRGDRVILRLLHREQLRGVEFPAGQKVGVGLLYFRFAFCIAFRLIGVDRRDLLAGFGDRFVASVGETGTGKGLFIGELLQLIFREGDRRRELSFHLIGGFWILQSILP